MILAFLVASALFFEVQKVKPIVPPAIVVENTLLSHPWVLHQKGIKDINIEMDLDLRALKELSGEINQYNHAYSCEQIEEMLIATLLALQESIPFVLPTDLYSVFCIPETPQEWHQAPAPFHVYKRLYLGENAMGIPFYLDVRVFELENCSAEELIAWHLQTLDGEAVLLHRSENRCVYTSNGLKKRESAHGFASGKRALFFDCIEMQGRLFVLYAEAPQETFQKYEPLFNQLVNHARN